MTPEDRDLITASIARIELELKAIERRLPFTDPQLAQVRDTLQAWCSSRLVNPGQTGEPHRSKPETFIDTLKT